MANSSKNLGIKCCQIWAAVLEHQAGSHIWISFSEGQTPRTSLQPHQGSQTNQKKYSNLFPNSWENKDWQHEAPSLPSAPHEQLTELINSGQVCGKQTHWKGISAEPRCLGFFLLKNPLITKIICRQAQGKQQVSLSGWFFGTLPKRFVKQSWFSFYSVSKVGL